MSMESLRERMREFAAGKSQSVTVSSADVSAEGGSGPTSGTVTAEAPAEARNDPFIRAGDVADAHSGISVSFDDDVDISEEDRSAFLSALVTGGRYERPFSLFDGRLTGTFRCRSVAESDGIVAWLSHCVNVKKFDAHIEYMTTMRNATLAAQVKSLRGLINEDFPEMPGPLAPTRSPDGKTVDPPGWLGAAEAWGGRPEALVSAVHVELQKFERRYWAMVANSATQNFWNPAASI